MNENQSACFRVAEKKQAVLRLHQEAVGK
jgi:hypothetical protein